MVNGQGGVDIALEPKAEEEEEVDSGSEGSESGRASQDGLLDSYKDALAQKLEQDEAIVEPSERRESGTYFPFC